MRPRKLEKSGSDGLFRSRLDQIINMKHPLVALSDRVDWAWFPLVVKGLAPQVLNESQTPGLYKWAGKFPPAKVLDVLDTWFQAVSDIPYDNQHPALGQVGQTLARVLDAISVSIGHDAVTTHPASIIAPSIASQPDVDLCAKTITPTPSGRTISRARLIASVICSSKSRLSVCLYRVASHHDSSQISWAFGPRAEANRSGKYLPIALRCQT